jgi:hypothetical protein
MATVNRGEKIVFKVFQCSVILGLLPRLPGVSRAFRFSCTSVLGKGNLPGIVVAESPLTSVDPLST